MININKSKKIALYAILELSRNTEIILSAGDIAGCYGISEHHVAKILQHLKRFNLIRSIRGVKGGFQLLINPKDLSVADVLETFGPIIPSQSCVLFEDGSICNNNVCSIGELFGEINEQAFYTLKSISFSTLLATKVLF